ncbi:hypothetical protein [Sulfurospirillum barnesii]|uniref:Lipoprotein n=1 Tax=Sulfurospirillum barnesii (strain ATCC 700032 / DSM 10660 / SES-3) TaxID=760154 RepID=I3Y005_SULBS|nr:hypothetical protein [Sulfurospirillum barnesii]AFL69529.1 hypothetical protein Sulba_2254 [Sulfurospirillum barnesii SES-3]
MKSIIGGIFLVLLLSGCSHKISIAPSLNDIREVQVENKADVNVGYYISDEAKKTATTTPGGGGDNITYTPYADLEGALNTMLSRKFKRVYAVKSLEDKAYIANKNIIYLFTTTIKTDSSSTNVLIWPPTDFTVELSCNAVNLDGAMVWSDTMSAKGHASAGELMKDFSLSAKRATETAFKEMLLKLEKTDKFNQ